MMISTISSLLRPTLSPPSICTLSCGDAVPMAVKAAIVAISRVRRSGPGRARALDLSANGRVRMGPRNYRNDQSDPFRSLFGGNAPGALKLRHSMER